MAGLSRSLRVRARLKRKKRRGTPTVTKAREILRDGTIRGTPISTQQKRFFAFIAGGGTPTRRT